MLALLAGGACSPAPPDPRVQAIVDRYAPDLRLGERVGYEARRRYKLRVTPYTGYTDTSYVARQGLRGLSIKVDEYVDEGNRRVSPDARIEMISLRSRDSATTASVESELRAALGAPSERCYLATATRIRRAAVPPAVTLPERVKYPRFDTESAKFI